MNENLSEPPVEIEYVKFQNLEKPRKTFFYQRKDADGDVFEDAPIFACYEQEAGLYGKFHKMIGVSDGTAYYNSLKTSGVKPGQVITVQKAREILKTAFDAELKAARGHKERPVYKNIIFDDSIMRHKNGRSIMESFNPPE